jgi:hypothetical protein
MFIVTVILHIQPPSFIIIIIIIIIIINNIGHRHQGIYDPSSAAGNPVLCPQAQKCNTNVDLPVRLRDSRRVKRKWPQC